MGLAGSGHSMRCELPDFKNDLTKNSYVSIIKKSAADQTYYWGERDHT